MSQLLGAFHCRPHLSGPRKDGSFGPLWGEKYPGVSAVMCIGGDPVPGISMLDAALAFEKDRRTRIIAAYGETGYPDEWKLHHQGGSVGYEPREHVATAISEEIVWEGQAFAWNPSITGTKSEDTILVRKHSNEILTAIRGWPTIEVRIDDQVIPRPAILVIE